MNVTQEMVDKAKASYVYNSDRQLSSALRCALEAALADVPEPYELTSDLVNADRKAATLEARIRELEAQLQRARAWWENAEIDPELGPLGVILGCLDEEEP